MDACWRLLSTREAKKSYEAIAEVDFSFSHAEQLPKCIHNSTDALTVNQSFYDIRTLLYQILVSPNSLTAYRRAIQWLHCVISVRPQDYGAR